jgi:undecaprenyl-diphosphatase
MLNLLYEIDAGVYYWVNTILTNRLADMIMAAVTSSRNWMPVFVAGILGLLWKGGTRGRICALTLLITVAISDPVNSRIIKPAFQRERPSHSLVFARVLAPDNGGYSFPSTHAANMFAAAYILRVFYARRRFLWYSLAALVAYSRVYVGVHFPGDVLAGAVVGTALAWLVLRLLTRWDKVKRELA